MWIRTAGGKALINLSEYSKVHVCEDGIFVVNDANTVPGSLRGTRICGNTDDSALLALGIIQAAIARGDALLDLYAMVEKPATAATKSPARYLAVP